MRYAAFLIPLAALAITGCQPASPPPKNDSIAVPAPAPGPKVDLSGHVGKYPFDRVDGLKFTEVSAVRAAILGAVRDPEVRKWLTWGDAGPSTPIRLRDGMLISWGCEAHNCGPHNWTLLIRPDGSGAQICYYDSEAGDPRWFAEGEPLAKKEPCPSGDAA
ncbi:hypothetical protein P1X14_11415 [Sphingomonas sp. AOB5]|uniref:hypothetical protein n=1 Tax=Sphingomonas sp. AOB5 TaxID=3034017 RepID=UPI0023F9497A|nr:hypothetical protein [Sphingomonas sp. AOB5]MDF7775857.1 hypothetical protein [Sphingomonas sp. AOB5]